MNIDVAREINNLRIQGYGSTRIADTLGLSVNTVKSHIRRHPEVSTGLLCPECGRPIAQNPKRKTKKFCSDKCRNAWWNSHQDRVDKKAYYTLVCKCCGKEFQSYGNKNRKYCSRACYDNVRRKIA